ncbi:MAG TPA: allantoinase AllB [Kiritimatiellia bacterium]|nr:allantoinase AllB [Kiritimatiellia bacterium]
MKFALQSTRVVMTDGTRPAAVLIEDGRIAAVFPHGEIPQSVRVEDVGARVVMPGLVDPHVHINEPGRTAWEGFETATQAAAAGGVTTLVDMPLNSSPVTVTASALEQKIAASEGKRWVDVGFHAGLVPGHVGDLDALIRAGVLGVKAFLVHSGIDDFPAATEAELRAAMPLLANHGVPLLVHAEVESAKPPPRGDARSPQAWLASRPPAWEIDAIELVLRLCRETRAPIHIVHLSAAGAVPMLIRAKVEKLPVTVETCPHYLFFNAEDIPEGDTRYKCAPPIRERLNNEQLWGALLQGTIDLLATDHSPCPPAMKALDSGDFFRSWGGIASLQWSLPIVWTAGREIGVTFDQLARWMCEAPARLAGLRGRKGAIVPGADADLVVWEPDAAFTVQPESTYHRHKVSPYMGRRLYGVVERTYLRGRLVAHRGVVQAGAHGQLMRGRGN